MWAHDVQHATHAHEPVEHAAIHELRKVVGRSLRLGRLQLRTRRPAPLQRCGCTAWHLRMLTAAGAARWWVRWLLVACALADSASRPPSLRVRHRSVRARWRVSTTPRVSIACCAGCAKSGSRAHSASPIQNEAGACTRPSAAALHLLCTNPAAPSRASQAHEAERRRIASHRCTALERTLTRMPSHTREHAPQRRSPTRRRQRRQTARCRAPARTRAPSSRGCAQRLSARPPAPQHHMTPPHRIASHRVASRRIARAQAARADPPAHARAGGMRARLGAS